MYRHIDIGIEVTRKENAVDGQQISFGYRLFELIIIHVPAHSLIIDVINVPAR